MPTSQRSTAAARLALRELTRGRTVALDGPVTVGREIGRITFPEDQTLARQHFELTVCGGGHIFIQCLASPEPTRLNGQRIPSSRKIEVHAGDRIEAGAQSFEIGEVQVLTSKLNVPVSKTPQLPNANSSWSLSWILSAWGLVFLIGLAFALSKGAQPQKIERAPSSLTQQLAPHAAPGRVPVPASATQR